MEAKENFIADQNKKIVKLEFENTELQQKLEFERFAKTEAFQGIIKLRQQFNRINEPGSGINLILATFAADKKLLEDNLNNNQEIIENEKINIKKLCDNEEETIKLLSEEKKKKTSMFEENNLAAANKKLKLSEISKTLTVEIENINLKEIEEEQYVCKKEIERNKNEITFLTEEIEKQEKRKQEINAAIETEELQYLKRMEEVNISFDNLNDE